MNTCKHCGFVGETEHFVCLTGSVCKNCNKKREKRNSEKFRKNNPGKFIEYRRTYRNKNREKICEREKERRDEIREKVNTNQREHYRNNRAKHGILPWSEIKHLRLGLYIEQTIAGMFGSVTEQYGTPGIDFVCPQGYKMQVKVSSLNGSKYPNWSFNIKKNNIADYFVLVAVNDINDIDKEDFKPEHIWMMEGNLINKQTGVSVSPSTISKWDKYSIMKEYENKFVACCNIIKKEKG